MKAIETTYRGVAFRSRLEARWAVFFDKLGIEWEYEPEGYEAGGTRYLPDFWLPTVLHRGRAGGLYFEVKASSPLEGEVHKARMLAWGSGKPVVIAARAPRAPDCEHLLEYVGGKNPWEDDGLAFGRCDDCGRFSVDFYVNCRTRPCRCRIGGFDMWDDKLGLARGAFYNFCRWEGRAA